MVLGGLGFFGAAAVKLLKAEGIAAVRASRRAAADVQVDVEKSASLQAALRAGDVVIDTVGPFQERTTALVAAALEIGFDVIDISDSLAYTQKVYGLQQRIEASGIRVLTACSSLSAVSAAMVRLSGVAEPVRVTEVLAPATRYTANPGSGGSLLRSVGRPIRVLREGRLATETGWSEACKFRLPSPIGTVRGYLCESPDAVTLPRIWPSVRTVEFYVDSRTPGYNAVFALAARWRPVRRLVIRLQPAGLALARLLGARTGCLAFEIEGADGRVVHCALVGGEQGYLTPIVPAVLAARSIAEGRFEVRGLVPPDRHVEPAALLDYLGSLGIQHV